jgi:hypothetical protein
VQTTPASLQGQKTWIVHDLVQLVGESRIDRFYGAVDGDRQVAVKRYGSLVRLLDERAHKILRAVRFGLLGGGHHLVEQAGSVRRGCRGCVRT